MDEGQRLNSAGITDGLADRDSGDACQCNYIPRTYRFGFDALETFETI